MTQQALRELVDTVENPPPERWGTDAEANARIAKLVYAAIPHLKALLGEQREAQEPYAWTITWHGKVGNPDDFFVTEQLAKDLLDRRNSRLPDGAPFRAIIPLYSAPPLAEPDVEAAAREIAEANGEGYRGVLTVEAMVRIIRRHMQQGK